MAFRIQLALIVLSLVSCSDDAQVPPCQGDDCNPVEPDAEPDAADLLPVDALGDVPLTDADADADAAADAAELDAADAPDGDDAQPSDSDLDHDTEIDARDAPDLFEGPPRGRYAYSAADLDALLDVRAAAYHPEGRYAVVLERRDNARVYDAVNESWSTFDLSPFVGRIDWSDIDFSPDGAFALLTGTRVFSDAGEQHQGVIFRLDHETMLARLDETSEDTPFDQLSGLNRLGVVNTELTFAHDDAVPWLLARPVVSPWSATLVALDPDGELFLGSSLNQNAEAGCADFDLVSEAGGGLGALIACNIEGADTLYVSDVRGDPTWLDDLGNNEVGTLSAVESYRDGSYALVVNDAGTLYRFVDGQFNETREAIRFGAPTRAIGFQSEGARARVRGARTGSFGIAIEYRHPYYECPTTGEASCMLEVVSIPGFDAEPFNAGPDAVLRDVAWRPGCDGGFIVGGDATGGLVIAFDVETGVACD